MDLYNHMISLTLMKIVRLSLLSGCGMGWTFGWIRENHWRFG
ncbi:MAG: hypothetical protein R3C59_24285 [Planctomycetaceae bacterium]